MISKTEQQAHKKHRPVNKTDRWDKMYSVSNSNNEP